MFAMGARKQVPGMGSAGNRKTSFGSLQNGRAKHFRKDYLSFIAGKGVWMVVSEK